MPLPQVNLAAVMKGSVDAAPLSPPSESPPTSCVSAPTGFPAGAPRLSQQENFSSPAALFLSRSPDGAGTPTLNPLNGSDLIRQVATASLGQTRLHLRHRQTDSAQTGKIFHTETFDLDICFPQSSA